MNSCSQEHDENQYVSDVSTVDTVWLTSSVEFALSKFDTVTYTVRRFTVLVADYLLHGVQNFHQGLQESGRIFLRG